jgi:hypothetical protein
MAKIEDNDMLGTADVAKLMKTTSKTVRIWAEEGELKGHRLADGTGPWVFSGKVVREFLERDQRDRDPGKGGRPRKGE